MIRILKLAVLISVQSFIAVGMNMADTFMLNNMGQAQISGASFAGQITTFFLIVAMGLGMGAGVLTTRYWGMGDISRLKQTVTLLLRWELVLTVFFVGLVMLCPGWLMGLFTDDGEMLDYGVRYLQFLLPSYFAMAASQSCTIILRSAGKLMVPLLASVLGLGVNAGLNLLLIPAMEITGAALATTAAWTIQTVITCGYFFFWEKDIAYRVGDFQMEIGDLRRDYWHITLPVLFGDTMLGLGSTAMSMVMGHMGTAVAAANSVTVVVHQMSAVLHHGLAGAAGVIIGHSLGRGERGEAIAQGKVFTWLGGVIGLTTAAIIYVVRPWVIGHYEISPEAAQIAWQLMAGLIWTVVLQSVSGVLTKGVLRAGGDTRFLAIADVLFMWVLAVPLGIYAAWQGISAFWVFLLLRADLPLKCLWCLWRLRSGKWIKHV